MLKLLYHKHKSTPESGSMNCIGTEKSLNISFGGAQWLMKSGMEVSFSCVDDPNCFPFIYKTMYFSLTIIKN